jgi:hypothetical protein
MIIDPEYKSQKELRVVEAKLQHYEEDFDYMNHIYLCMDDNLYKYYFNEIKHLKELINHIKAHESS